jgi:chromate reductase
MSVTVTGIAGSLRAGSHARALLRTAARHMPPGFRLTIWDGLAGVPPFSEDLEAAPAPDAVAELRQLIGAADAVLIVTPEYNGSVPGQLKNALDWASRPRGAAVLEGKPAAVISTSPSPHGGAWALADLRKILTVIGADPVEAGLAVPQVHTRLTPRRSARRPGPGPRHHWAPQRARHACHPSPARRGRHSRNTSNDEPPVTAGRTRPPGRCPRTHPACGRLMPHSQLAAQHGPAAKADPGGLAFTLRVPGQFRCEDRPGHRCGAGAELRQLRR